jgi:predicted MFS family arabinose efflux permease
VLAAQLTFGLGWSAHLVQPKFLASALGANPTAIAHVMMMSPVASVLTIPLTVALLDTANRVWIFRGGLLLLLTASVGYGAIDHLTPLLFVLQAFVGASYAFSYNASAAIIADEAPRERLGEAIGLLGASNVVTNAIATTITEHVASAFGWTTAFRTSAALAIAALVLSMLLTDERRGSVRFERVSILPALRGPLAMVLVCSALVGAAFSAMFTFHQPYVLLLGGKSVSPFFVGFTITAVGVRVLFGSLGDRMGHREVSIGAMFAYGTVALATAWLRVDFLWAYGLAFGAAHGVLYPTLNTQAVHVAPEGARGRVIALYGGAFNVGVALATLAWGRIASSLGFPAIFIGAAVAAVTSALVLGNRKELRPAPRHERNSGELPGRPT